MWRLFLHLQKHKFDGMVLEVWSQLGGRFNRCLFLHNSSRFLNQMPMECPVNRVLSTMLQ